nr:YqzE family protein [Bacillus mediterraneensis]
MKTNEYIKYLTETAVKYLDQPKDRRKESKKKHKDAKLPFLYRWFGPAPILIIERFRKKGR